MQQARHARVYVVVSATTSAPRAFEVVLIEQSPCSENQPTSSQEAEAFDWVVFHGPVTQVYPKNRSEGGQPLVRAGRWSGVVA